MKSMFWIWILAVGIVIVPAADGFLSPAHAEEGWREEFESVCGKTDAAMTLSTGELKNSVERCDQLKAKIESEEESTRKIYLRRLKSCKEFYLYVLEARKAE